MLLLLFGDMLSLLWNAGILINNLSIFFWKILGKEKTNDIRFNPQDFRETFTAPWSPKTFELLELVYTHQYHFICVAVPDLNDWASQFRGCLSCSEVYSFRIFLRVLKENLKFFDYSHFSFLECTGIFLFFLFWF